MTIDTTTSQGQQQLATELERRKLRLHRDSTGYRVEARSYGSIKAHDPHRHAGGSRRTPEGRWATVATYPNLAAVAAAITSEDDDIQ